MINVETELEIIQVKKIGGSLGLIIPENMAKKQHLTLNSNVFISRFDDLTWLKGLHNFKKSTEQIMSEIDEGEEF